jgi:sorbitol-specific phosphotransferase system component IIC
VPDFRHLGQGQIEVFQNGGWLVFITLIWCKLPLLIVIFVLFKSHNCAIYIGQLLQGYTNIIALFSISMNPRWLQM